MNLLYQVFWSDSLVVFAANNPITDSDCQFDEWQGSQNLREKREKEKKNVYRDDIFFKRKPK